MKSALFPLRENVRSTDIPRLIAACEKAGLVRCYSDHEGKKYVEINKFRQRTRAEVSKFPSPPTNGSQMTVTCLTDDGPPRTYSEAETETDAILPETAKPVRARDVLFDALATAEGSDPKQLTKGAARTVAVALAEIKKACPSLTPDEIQRRATRYAKVMPQGSTLTVSALAKHWARCTPALARFAPLSSPDGPKAWRETLKRILPENTYDGTWSGLPDSIKRQVESRLRRSSPNAEISHDQHGDNL